MTLDLTEKNYIKIARVLNRHLNVYKCREFAGLVADFEAVLQEDNPNFNKARFNTACYRVED